MDRTIMADYVLAHSWLQAALPKDFVADVQHYPQFLFWCGDILRRNPCIKPAFKQSLDFQAQMEKITLPVSVDGFEALAVEWLLQGLVEIQPTGIK